MSETFEFLFLESLNVADHVQWCGYSNWKHWCTIWSD